MTAFPRRKLGPELEVSALGLGCMGMSAFYGPADEDEAVRTIHSALDLGVDFLDTADVYREHTVNEELVGRAIAGRRDEVTLATKFGHTYDEAHGDRDLDGRPEYARWACEQSLRRLQTSWIDLYYLHRPDPATPIEETVGGMSELVREGKVRYLGLSEVLPETLRRAAQVHPIAAVQSEYSLFERSVESEVLPACRELGVGFVAYSPLSRGALGRRNFDTAQLHSEDWRRSEFPRLEAPHMARNGALLDALEELAGELALTQAQLALAWLLTRPDVVPLPGMRRREHLQENAAAVTARLTDDVVRRLDELFAPGVVSGDRYPEYAAAWLDHGTPEPTT